ncbi:MAG: alpha/beta hydrolase [Anaerolineales bacterium]|nr:alpha/beta hydrolase [Anaerolineales bacterium]
MTPENWRQTGHIIKFKDYDIYTRVVGTHGPAVLVLHGFPTSSYDYARLMPLLADHYRFILFDFLGYGFSDKPQKHPYSLFEQADVAEAVASYYGLEHVYVLTHDMGNSVVLELMKRGRLSIERVVMLNGSVLLTHYRPVVTQKLLLHPTIGPLITRLRLIRRPLFARQFGKLFAQRPSAEEIIEFWSLIQYHDGMANYHLLIQYLSERRIHELTWLDALAQHTAPLTVIWGQRDPVAIPKIAEAILERRPDTTYFPLDEIGHFPQWEAPQTVANIVHKAFS